MLQKPAQDKHVCATCRGSKANVEMEIRQEEPTAIKTGGFSHVVELDRYRALTIYKTVPKSVNVCRDLYHTA